MIKNKSFNPEKIHNILIVNVHSAKNAGDYALLRQTIYYIENAFVDINITIMANWPKESALSQLGKKIIASPWWIVKVWDNKIKPRYQVLSLFTSFLWLLLFRIDKWKCLSWLIPKVWWDLFSIYENTDLVVAVSGNQLFSSGRFGWPLLVVGFPIYLARFFKKKIIVFPQSVGPLSSNFDRNYVRFLYNNVDKLYIRDQESLDLMYQLKIKKSNPSFMHDVAFTFPSANCTSTQKNFHKEILNPSLKKLGMTVIASMPSYLDAENMQRYYLSIAKTIDSLIKFHDFHVFLFCQVFGPTDDENDNLGIKQVLELLPFNEQKNVHIINQKLYPSELKACYGYMDVFLASRLHSGIFSLSMGVPTLFIGYLYKTIGVLRAIELEKYYIDLEDISTLDMTAQITDMWNEKEEIKHKIKEKTKVIEEDLARFSKQLIADLTH